MSTTTAVHEKVDAAKQKIIADYRDKLISDGATESVIQTAITLQRDIDKDIRDIEQFKKLNESIAKATPEVEANRVKAFKKASDAKKQLETYQKEKKAEIRKLESEYNSFFAIENRAMNARMDLDQLKKSSSLFPGDKRDALQGGMQFGERKTYS